MQTAEKHVNSKTGHEEHKEGIVVVGSHLTPKAIPPIVNLVGGGTEQVVHCIGNAIVCSISKIRREVVGANY